MYSIYNATNLSASGKTSLTPKFTVVENYKTKEHIKFKGCEIQLIGPTSMSTNEITMQEAEMIYKMLGEYLESKKGK